MLLFLTLEQVKCAVLDSYALGLVLTLTKQVNQHVRTKLALQVRNADWYECDEDEHAKNDVLDISHPRGREFRRRCVQRVKVESREMRVSAVNVSEQDRRVAATL